MDPSRRYRYGNGFSFRRESFGGILFHFEGIRPDPKITFISSPFLIDLLEALGEHPDRTLADLMEGVREHFDLKANQLDAIHSFFSTLTERGALVCR